MEVPLAQEQGVAQRGPWVLDGFTGQSAIVLDFIVYETDYAYMRGEKPIHSQGEPMEEGKYTRQPSCANVNLLTVLKGTVGMMCRRRINAWCSKIGS